MRARSIHGVVNDFVEWVQHRDYYRDQIRFQRDIPARSPVTRSCEMEPQITDYRLNKRNTTAFRPWIRAVSLSN
jgi:hypothetical protein